MFERDLCGAVNVAGISMLLAEYMACEFVKNQSCATRLLTLFVEALNGIKTKHGQAYFLVHY